MIRTIFFACLMLITFPVMAYDLGSEEIEGISLNMTMDQAVSVLEAKGYKKHSEKDETVRGYIILEKGPYKITIARGLQMMLPFPSYEPDILVEIAKKSSLAGYASPDNHDCEIVTKAVEKFCNDGIETPNKDCSLRTRVELHEVNDKFTYRYEALFAPGKYCYKLVTRKQTRKR